MGLKDDLGTRGIIAIGLILFGVMLLLIRSIGIYVLYTGIYPRDENFLRWQLLLHGLSHLGQFILGTGFFLSFMMIDERLKINRYFKTLNIGYLVTITPNLYYSQVYFFENYLYNAPKYISRLFHFGMFVLPAVSHLLFVILLLSIFISLFKTEKSEKNGPMFVDSLVNDLDNNSKDKDVLVVE